MPRGQSVLRSSITAYGVLWAAYLARFVLSLTPTGVTCAVTAAPWAFHSSRCHRSGWRRLLCYRRAHPGHHQRDLSVILWELSRLDRFPDDEVREACICASGSLDEAAWELYAPSVSYQDTGADP